MTGAPAVLVFGTDCESHTFVDLLVDTWNAFVVVTVGPAVVLVVLVIVVDHPTVFNDIVFLDKIVLVVSVLDVSEALDDTEVVANKGLSTNALVHDSVMDSLVKSSLIDTCVKGQLMGGLEGFPLKDSLVREPMMVGDLMVWTGSIVKVTNIDVD